VDFDFELSSFIPFRDKDVCARVRKIAKSDIARHDNPDFEIRVIEDPGELYLRFALDLVSRLRETRAAGKRLIAILPVGPLAQYEIAARMINAFRISCAHLHGFLMDEYADQDGNTAPVAWEGSFQSIFMRLFVSRIDEELRPPAGQICGPSAANLSVYGKMIEDLGGADVCYGGVGWCGHFAFWEAHLGAEFGGDLRAFSNAGPRLVELHPMTIMQNALQRCGGDWSWIPPKAATIGPAQILGARVRKFWLDGYLGGGVSWQRFIARLAAHGPVTPLVPASILQTVPTTYTILGAVAEDVVLSASRRAPGA
jgi:glucosamine-6-phosphate deaminase